MSKILGVEDEVALTHGSVGGLSLGLPIGLHGDELQLCAILKGFLDGEFAVVGERHLLGGGGVPLVERAHQEQCALNHGLVDDFAAEHHFAGCEVDGDGVVAGGQLEVLSRRCDVELLPQILGVEDEVALAHGSVDCLSLGLPIGLHGDELQLGTILEGFLDGVLAVLGERHLLGGDGIPLVERAHEEQVGGNDGLDGVNNAGGGATQVLVNGAVLRHHVVGLRQVHPLVKNEAGTGRGVGVGKRVVVHAVERGRLKRADGCSGPFAVVAVGIPGVYVAHRVLGHIDGAGERGHHDFFFQRNFQHLGVDVEVEGVGTRLTKIDVRAVVGGRVEYNLGVKSHLKAAAEAR